MAEFRTFKDLECWKVCRELRMFIACQVIPALPRDEKYRLGDQMIRSARSTTANIAEGYGRYHYLDSAKFVSNSRGSAHETHDHLITAHDEKFISVQLFEQGEGLIVRSIRLLNGYIHYLHQLSRTTPAAREPETEYSICSSSSSPYSPAPPSSHSTILPFPHSS